MLRTRFLYVTLITFAVCLGCTRKAHAQASSLSGECKITIQTATTTSSNCCPPPGTTGHCIIQTQHHPVMENPPSSCNVAYIYEYVYTRGPVPDGYVLDVNEFLYDIDPESLSCE